MPRSTDIKNLIIKHERHLQKLKEQKASFGLYAPPYILIEIEDIEAELNRLQIELASLGELALAEEDDDVVTQIVLLLDEKEFDSASEILQGVPENSAQAGYANLLRALILLAGRSFNAIRPMERTRIEKCLISARKKMGDELMPLIFLAILEMDYYSYHGQVSENDISPDIVTQRLAREQLPEKDKVILKLLKASDEARNKLGLN